MSADGPVDVDVPVLIIGAGPAGLSTALLLGRLGTPCILAERRPSVGTHPRATGVRIRTMELFRAWGIDAEVARHALPVKSAGDMAWVHTVAGEEFGRFDIGAARDDGLQQSATPMTEVFCPQDRVEPVLLDAVRQYPSVDVRLATEVRDLRPGDSGANALLVDAAGSTRVRAKFVVACDGGSSPTRQALGINVAGPGPSIPSVNVDFRADLGPYVGDYSAVIHWVINSRSCGMLAARDGRSYWYYSVMGGDATAADPSDSNDWVRIIREAVGVPDLPVEIEAVRHWVMDAKVAESFRRGSVFLVGDAAHRFPPAGGFGMNSSIQDAHNLVWKLHAVLSGWAGPELLDTYQGERRPIAEFNAGQSWRNMALMAETGIGRDIVEFGRGLEAERDAGGDQPLRAKIRRGIPVQSPQFDALGQDIGFSYPSGALISDGSEPPMTEDPQFVHSGAPGRRAPHHYLHRDGTEISTLDLFGTSLTLLAGEQGEAWVTAARAAANGRGIPLRAFRVGTDADLHDPTGTWAKSAGVGDGGACLVRPDGHVAWRTGEPADGDARTAIGTVLDSVLSRRPD